MRSGMPASSVAGIVEQRRRRIGSGEGPVIADVGPEPRRIGLALGHDRHRRIVAVQSLGGQIELNNRSEGGTVRGLDGELRGRVIVPPPTA